MIYKIIKKGEYPKDVEFEKVGNLDELFGKTYSDSETTIYAAQHKGPYGQEIILGQPVSMPRSECDNDSNSSCSRGLHCKSISYGMGFGNNSLVTIVNPYNVVAIPNDEFNKFRCAEYLPISKAEVVDGKIVEFEAGTYDIPYDALGELTELLKTNSLEELQSSGVVSAEVSLDDFNFVMKEAMKIISNRVVKLN